MWAPALESVLFVNQRLPSGPATIPSGRSAFGVEQVVTAPAGVIRLTEPPCRWVNQTLPSGPAAMPVGLLVLASWYVVIAPAVVLLPIQLLPAWVNQRFPSGPAVIDPGDRNPLELGLGSGKLVTAPLVV